MMPSRARELLNGRRLEESRGGRVAISVVVAALVGLMVISNLPAKYAATRRAQSITDPVVERLGLYQGWAVFSPPRNEVLQLEARVTYADGHTSVWHLPKNNPVVGSYRDYHWQKYMEHAALRGMSDEWPRLWEPLARYIARDVEGPDRKPVRVTLITHRTQNLPLGKGLPLHGPERVDEYYTLDLPPTAQGS
ncbi:MAG: hypothetical protein U0V73_12160 [Acidimicrobiia bacterium]